MSQIIITVIIPITLAVFALLYSDFSVIAGIYGVISFVIDIWLIESSIKVRRVKAAKIQELFDCYVLQLPTSPLKTIDDIDVEEVLLNHDIHSKVTTNIEKIRDWYSVKIKELPLAIARIVCQRTNCWWDAKLREKYSTFLKVTSIFVFLSILITGYLLNATLIQITLIGAGLVPFFQFCVKQIADNSEASARLNELARFSRSLWNDALDKCCTEELIEINCRRLQDEIYEHRSKSPLILDFFYKFFRDETENLMNSSAVLLVEEANKKL